MNGRKRFPLLSLLSLLTLMALGFSIFQICRADQSVPQRALSQMRVACGQVIDSIKMLAGAAAETAFYVGDTSAQNGEDPMPMLVNNAQPVPDGYSMQNPVRMRDYCDSNVVYIKGSEIDGEKEAVDALMVMLRAAIADGVSNWQISAGYRSIAYQQKLWDNTVYSYRQEGYSSSQAREATAKKVAKPGSSEHHTGLAFDVTVPGKTFSTTKQSKWLNEHCWEYGFIIRYTEEKKKITGIGAEAWHIRYVGQPHAILMRDNNWCLEEYLEAR